jgi:hypothetical protein
MSGHRDRCSCKVPTRLEQLSRFDTFQNEVVCFLGTMRKWEVGLLGLCLALEKVIVKTVTRKAVGPNDQFKHCHSTCRTGTRPTSLPPIAAACCTSSELFLAL